MEDLALDASPPTTAEEAVGGARYIDRHVPSIYAEAVLGASVGGGTIKLTFIESVFNPISDSSAVRPTHHLVMSPESFGKFAVFVAGFAQELKLQSTEK